MKRHPSLVPLARQHHGALLLAQMLKLSAPDYNGMPTDAAGKTQYALEFFKNDLLPHFAAEEKVFEQMKGIDAVLDQALLEVTEEHIVLRDLFHGLPDHAADSNYQDKIGQMLEKHVRREDRELFPLMETLADEATMASIAAILHD